MLPRPVLPTEMTGEANLRETARVIADSIALRARDPAHPYPLTDGRPAVAMFPVLSREAETIIAWAEATAEAIAARREFIHGVLIAGDSVVLVDHGVYHARIDAYEFALYRPATGVRGMYHTEAALVARAADLAAIPLGGLHLYYLRKELSRDGDPPGDGAELYLESNLLKRARKGRQRVDADLAAMKAAVVAEWTVISTYECDQRCELCVPRPRAGLDRYHPLTLHKGGARGRELVAAGITDLRDDALDNVRLTERQRIQVQTVRGDSVHVDGRRLEAFLGALDYPLWYLDFEAFAPALPPFNGLSPYGHTPVVASVHIQRAPGMDLEAQSFVADPGCDQRREMYHWLCETVGEQGSIIVFSKNFETAMIRQLSRTAEDEAGADALVKRIVDLLDPFAEFWVYHPEQRGKVSLKRLLPVYTRHAGYRESPVRDGMHANLGYMRLYDRAVAEPPTGQTWRRSAAAAAAEGVNTVLDTVGPTPSAYLPTTEEILRYCAVDTVAMHYLVEELRELLSAAEDAAPSA
jgi:hypothetical protein